MRTSVTKSSTKFAWVVVLTVLECLLEFPLDVVCFVGVCSMACCISIKHVYICETFGIPLQKWGQS